MKNYFHVDMLMEKLIENGFKPILEKDCGYTQYHEDIAKIHLTEIPGLYIRVVDPYADCWQADWNLFQACRFGIKGRISQDKRIAIQHIVSQMKQCGIIKEGAE